MLGPVTHGNALSVYFLDPEGNRVELLIDTPWYVPQPHRLVVDIEGATLNNVLQTISSKVQQNDPYIANIRVGQNTATTVRVG